MLGADLDEAEGLMTDPRLASIFDEVSKASLIIVGEGAEVGESSDREGKQWSSVGHGQRIV